MEQSDFAGQWLIHHHGRKTSSGWKGEYNGTGWEIGRSPDGWWISSNGALAFDCLPTPAVAADGLCSAMGWEYKPPPAPRVQARIVHLLIIDHDEVGDKIATVIENARYPNRCISPNVLSEDVFDIGQWDDDHPLNSLKTPALEWISENASVVKSFIHKRQTGG